MDAVAAPERLNNTEGAFRDLLGALPAAIYVTDAAGRITYYNDAAVALWGLRPVRESKFCGSWRLYRPDGTPLPHDECPMAMALKKRMPIRGAEAIAVRPDGVRVPFHRLSDTILRCVRNVDRRRQHACRHQRAQASRAGTRRTQHAAGAGREIALVGSFAFDIVSGECKSRRAMQRSTAWPMGLQRPNAPTGELESTRTTCNGWRPPPATPIAERRREHYCEYRIVRSEGQIRWIESRSSISYDREGAPQRIVGANIDVTERKQTEGVLKESEVRLADVLAAGQVIAFEWDASTGRSRRSDNAAHILGDPTRAWPGFGAQRLLEKGPSRRSRTLQDACSRALPAATLPMP